MPRRASNLQTTEKAGLDSRAEVLLAALIKEHLVTGEAVGSRVLSDRFSHGFGWSPATIRNVMGDLEESGFVEQPHTSAGRVPTDKGYRYYVDNMLGEARLSRNGCRGPRALGLDFRAPARRIPAGGAYLTRARRRYAGSGPDAGRKRR